MRRTLVTSLVLAFSFSALGGQALAQTEPDSDPSPSPSAEAVQAAVGYVDDAPACVEQIGDGVEQVGGQRDATRVEHPHDSVRSTTLAADPIVWCDGFEAELADAAGAVDRGEQLD